MHLSTEHASPLALLHFERITTRAFTLCMHPHSCIYQLSTHHHSCIHQLSKHHHSCFYTLHTSPLVHLSIKLAPPLVLLHFACITTHAFTLYTVHKSPLVHNRLLLTSASRMQNTTNNDHACKTQPTMTKHAKHNQQQSHLLPYPPSLPIREQTSKHIPVLSGGSSVLALRLFCSILCKAIPNKTVLLIEQV